MGCISVMGAPCGRTTFGGVCLEEEGIVVERVHDEITDLEDELEDITGGDGSVHVSLRVPARTITLECRAFDDRWDDFDYTRDWMMAHFLSDRSDRELKLRTRPHEHYMAHLVGYSEGDRFGGTGVGAFTLTFVASDPFRIADEPSSIGFGYTFDVGGTIPAAVHVSCEDARRDGETNLWGLRFDDATVLRVPLPSEAAHDVKIDCARRTVTVDGAQSMITLESDWPQLSPGEHYIALELGAGDTTTIEWRERSL